MPIKIIVASPPEYTSVAARPGCAVAHMSYRIGRGFRLYRSQRAGNAKDGLMVLDVGGWTGGGPLMSLVDDVMRECFQRDFVGIVINIGTYTKPESVLSNLSKALASASRDRGLSYFVPEFLSDSGENAIVRVSASISGGTLTRHISDAVKKYGTDRIAVEVDRVCMDFALPSPLGIGQDLSVDELRSLMNSRNPVSFFSPELMTNYFTYRNDGVNRIVLYDNGESLRRKITAAENAGVNHAFLFYPRIIDVYDEIVP